MKHSHVARIMVTILTDILALTNSVLGIKCLVCSVQAIESLPPKKCIQSVCLYLELFYTVHEIKCNHRFKCYFNAVCCGCGFHPCLRPGCLHSFFSTNIPAYCQTPSNLRVCPSVLTQSLRFRNPRHQFPAVWKTGEDGPLKKRIYMVL